MPIIQWTTDFSVGYPDIDEQHKKLVSLINALYDAMKEGQGKQVLSATLKDLVDYTRTHFSYEEGRMSAARYPGLAAHIVEHEKLTQKVLDFQSKYDSGQVAITVQLMEFLKDWLTNHIQATDKLYMKALQ